MKLQTSLLPRMARVYRKGGQVIQVTSIPRSLRIQTGQRSRHHRLVPLNEKIGYSYII